MHAAPAAERAAKEQAVAQEAAAAAQQAPVEFSEQDLDGVDLSFLHSDGGADIAKRRAEFLGALNSIARRQRGGPAPSSG